MHLATGLLSQPHLRKKSQRFLLRIQIGPNVQLPFFLQQLKVASGSLGLDGIGLLQVSWSQVERFWEKRHELSLKKEMQLLKKTSKPKGYSEVVSLRDKVGEKKHTHPWKRWDIEMLDVHCIISKGDSEKRVLLLMEEIRLATGDVKNPVDNGINYLPINWLAGFLPSTVSCCSQPKTHGLRAGTMSVVRSFVWLIISCPSYPSMICSLNWGVISCNPTSKWEMPNIAYCCKSYDKK